MTQTINIKCKGSGTASLEDLIIIQGGLKYLPDVNYQKLRESILVDGFTNPIFIWKDPSKKLNVLDGTQRITALRRMQDEGIKIPLLPVVEQQADSLKHAKEQILRNISENGVKDNQTFFKFLEEAEINFAEISGRLSIQGIDLKQIEKDVAKLNRQRADAILAANPPEMETVTISEGSVPQIESTEDEVSIPKDRATGIFQYNLDAVFPSSNKFGIPDLMPEMLSDQIPDEIYYGMEIPDPTKMMFLQGSVSEAKKTEGVHKGGLLSFYTWDDQFIKVWDAPQEFADQLKKEQWGSVVSPNFSVWADSPVVMQMMRIYQSRWCARFWQETGIKIIPDINWSDSRSFEFCFLGVPRNTPVISVQSQGLNRRRGVTEEEMQVGRTNFLAGLNEAVRRINPKTVLIYAGKEHRSWIEPFLLPGPKYIFLHSWSSARREHVPSLQRKKKEPKPIKVKVKKAKKKSDKKSSETPTETAVAS